MSDIPWTRGLPNGQSKGIVRVFAQCQTEPRNAALVNAAEVWYKVEHHDGTLGEGGKVIAPETTVYCRYPCPCPTKEHEAVVARIDG